MLGEYTDHLRKIYLNIAHGAIIKTENGKKETFLFVEGGIKDIYHKKRTFNGQETTYWYIDLKDEESGELYSLAFPYSSNVYKSIILSLASKSNLKKGDSVKIEPYEKAGNTKVKTFCNGEKLDWVIKPLPPIEEVEVNGAIYKDDRERMALIAKFSLEVRERLNAK